MLEELAERDLSEVIPILVEKIKMWEKRKAMQIRLQAHARRFLMLTYFKKARKSACIIQHRQRGAEPHQLVLEELCRLVHLLRRRLAGVR